MIDASKLLAFANKLEDDYKEQGYKWLYDKLRYEIVRQNQTELNNNEFLDLVSGCIRTDEFGSVFEASGNDPCLECKFKDLPHWSDQCGHCVVTNRINECYR